MSKKYKKVCITEHLLILASIITGYISISAFASLLGIPVVITSSAIRLNICVVTGEIEKYIRQQLQKRKRSMIK